MVEIGFLTESDRADWEVLVRGKDAYFDVTTPDEAYDRVWGRLHDDGPVRGIATAVIDWVARDAAANGYPGLYWNTLEDAEARALYDRIGRHHQGLVHYGYRRDASRQEERGGLVGEQG